MYVQGRDKSLFDAQNRRKFLFRYGLNHTFMHVKACPHDGISCTQRFSNSQIPKLSLWFQQNSTKESHGTNRIVCTVTLRSPKYEIFRQT